jgi:hypothetical protein
MKGQVNLLKSCNILKKHFFKDMKICFLTVR